MKIFIAGGTSGIGFVLAQHYYQRGDDVGICGRNLEKMSLETPFKKYQVDVADYALLAHAVADFAADQTLDLFINCAGSYAEDVTQRITYDAAQAMLATNILGTVNCFEVARKQMQHQEKGHIVAIASAAGILDYPNSSLYAKSKHSIISMAKAYQRALSPFGIAISIIAPGYVKTQKLQELNHNNLSKKPFLVDEQVAVEEITKAIKEQKSLHIFPKKMKWLMRCLSFLPAFLLDFLMYQKAQWMKIK